MSVSSYEQRHGGVTAGMVAGAVLASMIWMLTYWPDAADRDERLDTCERERAQLIERGMP